ncbi:MAG: hypothetical protein HQL93_05930 [Magnetococcales bacterium]|nr:hypothetical protein [Magnetococcales bacterium]
MMDQEDKLSTSMGVLERRWDELAGIIRSLRERVAKQETQISEMETQLLEQQERQDGLEKEKAAVIARIEGLLARFEDVSA